MKKPDNTVRKIFSRILLAALSFYVLHAEADNDVKATIVWFVEQEAGIEPYRVRYIVTPDFMRSDEGRDEGAYTLFDRKRNRVYSVVPENRSVLHIDSQGEVDPAPASLTLRIDERVDRQAPAIGGDTPLRLDLLANDGVCHSAMVVPDLLQDVQAAMQAFTQALAVRQAGTLDNTPVEYQTPCFLARFLHASDFHWGRGMVLAEWNERGDRRELIDYEVGASVAQSLFKLPDDYVFILPAGQ